MKLVQIVGEYITRIRESRRSRQKSKPWAMTPPQKPRLRLVPKPESEFQRRRAEQLKNQRVLELMSMRHRYKGQKYKSRA